MEPEQFQQQEENLEQQEEIQQQYTVITDAKEYLDWCKKDKKIKIMDQSNPVNPFIYLKDISLHKKGPLEDKIYAKSKKYYFNVRRGNTLCQIYDNNQKSIDLFFCRRGMIKFYDLEAQYLKVNPKLTYRHKLVRKIIFSEIQKKLNQGGYNFHLYSLFKQNGQHCQIGYINKINSWLIASKNVTIIVNSLEDLEKYQKERFYWAKIIAKEFFNNLSLLQYQEIQNLKKDLEGKTLIGEYCGYEKHQHITKYFKIQIIYYAIVQNIGDKHCIPVQQAFDFFDKYKLKKVRTKIIKNITKHNQLMENIYNLLKEVGSGPMDIQGEGSVLYIVSQKQKKQQLVSLCKLKTTEYLIFRKLRQMLKIQLNKKGETANNIQKFKFDASEIIKNSFKPPKQLSYYIKVAQLAYKEVGNRIEEMEESELRYRFVTFLSQIQKNTEIQNISLKEQPQSQNQKSPIKRIVIITLPKTFDNSFQKQLKQRGIKVDDNYRQKMQNKQKYNISILYMVPRVSDAIKNQDVHFIICSYTDNQKQTIIAKLNKEKEPYNQNIIIFIKSVEKEKQLDLFIAKIEAFKIVCKQKGLNHDILEQNKERINDKIEQIFRIKSNFNLIEKPKQAYRYLIIPLLVPGSGKSTLVENFSKNETKYKINSICADKIRKEIYNQIKKKNPGKDISPQQLFKMSHKDCQVKFEQAFTSLINRPITVNQLLFLDRVFVPTTLQKKIQDLIQGRQDNHRIIFLSQESSVWRNCEYEYPFSITYLLNCFKRSIERQDHETLFTDQIETLKIILKFYQMFRNVKLGNLEKKFKNAKTLRIPFVAEQKDDEKEIKQNIKNKLKDCLKCITPGYDANQSNSFSEFVEAYYTYEKDIPVRNPKPQDLNKAFFEGVDKIIRFW